MERFHVVPKAYRRCLPDAAKTRKCHDVVRLCTVCHEKAVALVQGTLATMAAPTELLPEGVGKAAMILEKHLVAAGLAVPVPKKFKRNKKPPLPPDEKLAQSICIVAAYLDGDAGIACTDDLVRSICARARDDAGHEATEPLVVRFLAAFSETVRPRKSITQEAVLGLARTYRHVRDKVFDTPVGTKPVEDLVRFWRQDFLTSMDPKFLPRGWRVDFEVFHSWHTT